MIGLVLVMHGDLGQAFHAALEHVLGPQEQVACLTIAPDDNVAARRPDMERALGEVDMGDGALILTDVFGGTPCRIATAMLDRARVHVVAGVNLPMLIKLARVRRSSRLEDVVARARAAGQIHYYCKTGHEPDNLENNMETGVWVDESGSESESGSEWLSADVTIANSKGLHVRPSAKFVKCAESFEAEIRVSCGGNTVGGTSIMGLLMLGAGKGSVITIMASGREAEEAIAALADLVRAGFYEDEAEQNDPGAAAGKTQNNVGEKR